MVLLFFLPVAGIFCEGASYPEYVVFWDYATNNSDIQPAILARVHAVRASPPALPLAACTLLQNTVARTDDAQLLQLIGAACAGASPLGSDSGDRRSDGRTTPCGSIYSRASRLCLCGLRVCS